MVVMSFVKSLFTSTGSDGDIVGGIDGAENTDGVGGIGKEEGIDGIGKEEGTDGIGNEEGIDGIEGVDGKLSVSARRVRGSSLSVGGRYVPSGGCSSTSSSALFAFFGGV